MAPYAVRRAYYSRETELARAYRDCGEEILRGPDERSQTPLRFETTWSSMDDGPQGVGTFLSLSFCSGCEHSVGSLRLVDNLHYNHISALTVLHLAYVLILIKL